MQVPALAGKGASDPETMSADILLDDLPHDEQGNLLRPGVVWWRFITERPPMHLQHMPCAAYAPVILVLMLGLVPFACHNIPVGSSLHRFGETLDPGVLNKAQRAVEDADLFITVGTSPACTQQRALWLRCLHAGGWRLPLF